jgi:GNAT superfamily N-acetyltransferase
LAHYQWYAQRPVYLGYLDRTLRLSEGDYLTAEAFTHRALRGHQIHTAAYLRHLRRARDLGFIRCIGIAPWWNAPSLRVAQRAGFTCAGTLGYWKTGLGRKWFATGDVHLEEDGTFHIGP